MGKRLQKMVVFIAFISLATISHAEETGQCKDWVAKAAAVVGNVDAKRHGQQDWTPVKRNNTYCAGDQIRAAKASSATLVFTNETLVTLDQHTAITINQIENDGPSLIELVKGIAHFISRVPRSLKVNTPFVNAAIEGTEFVVEVGDNETNVTVFEGTVLTANDQGELRVTNNETSTTQKGQAPQKRLLARPRDAVQWALYFPPIIKSDIQGSNLQQASALLYSGLANEAKALISDDESGEAKALLAIIAIVNNQSNALELATEAVKRSPDSAASHIALSYAWQSRFDLTNAMASANTATLKEPNNAIAWARLAELQLSIGRLSRALESATKANELDPSLARTQTILGFAYLTQIKISKARETFNKAIELDQSDPLPHLGLGLAMIRRNELAEGRREIEIAAALDPNNSIIRSYLGKAYFEEKRGPLDAEQFAMAKELDPNDPTPHLYDAIRRQTENDPVGALKDINKSIELNDNRAVFRSSLQLDQDEAARNASLGRIYQDLNFEQLAINEASKSLALDPTNHSAHRLLADSYLSKSRHEIARVSENLQSKILNPLNGNPQQLQLNQGSLTLFNSIDTTSTANNELDSMFQRDGISLVTNAVLAGQNTLGFEGVIGGQYDWFAFSFGKYSYETDGYHENNGQDLILDNYFLQAMVTNSLSIFYERTEKHEVLGDSYRFYPENNTSNISTDDREDGDRIGLNYKINPRNTFLATYLDQDREFIQTQSFGPGANLFSTSDDKNEVKEVQYLYTGDAFNLNVGYSKTEIKGEVNSLFNTTPLAPTDFSTIDDSKGYVYWNTILPASLDLTLGFSYETYKTRDFDIKENNPKVGLSWSPNKNLNLRMAYLKALRKSDPSFTTLEPTMVAGFNQFYDDDPGTNSEQVSIGADYKISANLFSIFEITTRDLDVPGFDGASNPVFRNMTDDTGNISFLWTANKSIAISFGVLYEKLVHGSFPGNLKDFENVRTIRYPIGLGLFHNNEVNSKFTFSYIQQEGVFIDQASGNGIPGKDSFWHIDYAMNYLLPKRMGSISLGVKNLLDENFNFEETDRNHPTVAPELTAFTRINLNF